MPFVYLITNNLSQKKYVGKANVLSARWKAHRTDAGRERPKSCIGWALKKYGVGNFTFSVLATCVTEDEAYAEEARWVRLFQANQPSAGYNLDSGGMGGKIASETTRRKQSDARRGKSRPAGVIAKMHTPEARAKAASARRGQHHTIESRAKISAAHLGRPKSPDAVAKSAASHRGKHPSLEVRDKLSAAHKGVPHTPEHRAHLADANRRRGLTQEIIALVRELATRGLKQIEIAAMCGIGQTSVSRVLRRVSSTSPCLTRC
jgi:group I intron endonuclease